MTARVQPLRWGLWSACLLLALLVDWRDPAPALALPSGGQVGGGAATIQQPNAQTLNIQQHSDRALLNWQGFSIGQGETVQFVQPSSTSLAVNRVLGGDPSLIFGQLLANGRVFLLNPNGVLFGPHATVNVGGLLATTLSLKSYDLTTGRFELAQDPTQAFASVINQGTLRVADHGFLVLAAPGVVNDGLIVAKFGQVGLHAGTQLAVDFRGDGLIQYAVEGKVLDQVTDPAGKPLAAAVSNTGRIDADGGTVLLTGKASSAVVSSVINQSGVIQARRLESQGGEIVLRGGDEGVTMVAGTLDATGVTGHSSLVTGPETGGTITVTGDRVYLLGDAYADGTDGGRIMVQGHNLLQAGSLTANGQSGTGGMVDVLATNRIIQTEAALTSANGTSGAGGTVVVQAGPDGGVFTSGTLLATGQRGGTIHVLGSDLWLDAASLDASGNIGGGVILVGGDYQGQGDIPRAKTTEVNPSTTLKADARESGSGGTIIVWSDRETQFHGSASARGGAAGGDGGLIEVSSKGDLFFGGKGDAGAPAGTPGRLLLDPTNIVISNAGSFPQYTFNDPSTNKGFQFGDTVLPLSTGNVVITSPNDSLAAPGAGAVYLFNGQTAGLISVLTGSHAEDHVGSTIIGGHVGHSVTALTNGNYVVTSPRWDNGAAQDAGAVTWGSGITGVSGPVSAANSLVGGQTNDSVGDNSSRNGVTALTNGNYVVNSPGWANGAAQDAGAVTWGNGSTGITGLVSAANSLVGSQTGDIVGATFGLPNIIELLNGNYLVHSQDWANGAAKQAGAVTWANGNGGTVGPVSASNSLVGSQTQDFLGSAGVIVLANGNYVVSSPVWDNGAVPDAGASTWGNGNSGVTGVVSAANSLVGTLPGDRVSRNAVIELTNGHYVVSSPLWSNTFFAPAAGAVTWVNGTTGLTGPVSAANSLVGGFPFDQVGTGGFFGDIVLFGGVTVLPNGNYVVRSPLWADFAGAVTWGSGAGGTVGVVSAANSLVGTFPHFDAVGGTGITVLTNSNYVVSSEFWTNGTMPQAGAVTWGNGTTGITGAVSADNSLVGTQSGDRVGHGFVTALANGNYVAASQLWANGSAGGAGAVTWGNGTTGITGTVSVTNSLVGSHAGDLIGKVTMLPNGNYVVRSPFWTNGTAANAGAVTWGNGTTGVTGPVSAANSLVGTQAGDFVGTNSDHAIVLANGNYVVASPGWANGAADNAGAVTWGNGMTGITGPVSAANSLVGSTAEDQIGGGVFSTVFGAGVGGVTVLPNGNYVVTSPLWANGTATRAGAATWGDGTTGVTGAVSSINSMVGSKTGDGVGAFGVTLLTNGNYVVQSTAWGNGTAERAGAVTWANGGTGVTGIVSAANSLVGSQADDRVGSEVTTLADGNYIVTSPFWSNGGGIFAGAATWGNGATGVTGEVSPGNSLVGDVGVTQLQAPVLDPVNGTFLARFIFEGHGRVRAGFQNSAFIPFAGGGSSMTIAPSFLVGLLTTGTAVTLQATQDLTVTDPIMSSGAGALTLQAGRSLIVNANMSTAAGALTLEGNAAGTATGNFVGVDINGATLSTTTGAITVTGKGGNTGSNNHGILLRNGAQVLTTSGSIRLTGTGGSDGIGVLMQDGVHIESMGGPSHLIWIVGQGSGIKPGIQTSSTGADNVIGGASSSAPILMEAGTVAGADSIILNDVVIRGDIRLWPINPGDSIGIAGGAGVFNLSAADLDAILSHRSVAIGTGANPVEVGTYSFTGRTSIAGQTVRVIGDLATGGAGNHLALTSMSVVLEPGSSVKTADADVTILGMPLGGMTGNSVGVDLNGGTVSAAGSTRTVRIEGEGGTIGDENVGVRVRNGGEIRGEGPDPIAITVLSVERSWRPGEWGIARNVGVLVTGAGSTIVGNGGQIEIIGTGRGSGESNSGVAILDGGHIQQGAGSGGVHILGQGALADAKLNHGVEIAQVGSRVTSAGGEIRITGTGGGGLSEFGFSGFANHGVFIANGGQVEGTGSTPVTITGTGGLGGANPPYDGEVGVYIAGDTTGGGLKAVARTEHGPLTLNGTGGGFGGAFAGSTFGYGTLIRAGAVVEATGNGNLNILGHGFPKGGSLNHGVLVTQGAVVRSATGNVGISGIGGGVGDNNLGVEISGGALVQVFVPGTAITITGQGGGTSVLFIPNNRGLALKGAATRLLATDGSIHLYGYGHNGAVGVIASDGFVVGAPGIPCPGGCAPSFNLDAGAGGSVKIFSYP